MSHRQRDCTCSACIALGRVASVVVDEDTTPEHRDYIAKVLERSYTKILEKGLELLRRERRAADEGDSGVACHATPGSEIEEKEVKEEPQEEATKKKKRRKKKATQELESAIDNKDEPSAPAKDEEQGEEAAATSSRRSPTPEKAAESVSQPCEKDPRLPLPRKAVKPSSKPLEPQKEKKTREESTGRSSGSRPLNLRPKAKTERRRSVSRSRDREPKDKKKRRSPSPEVDHFGGDRGVSSGGFETGGEGATLVEAPPGNSKNSSLRTRRPRSPDYPPPLPRRPSRGQLWIGPIRAYKNKPANKKKNKGLKKELKNERYWERRRQRLWEERTRGYRRR